jgi:hypothetical protein
VSAAEGYQATRRSRLVAILRASSPDRLVAGAQVLVEEGIQLVTLGLITCGEATGRVESEWIGPLRLGGPMRMSMAGAESTAAIGVVRWEMLPTRAEVELLRGTDVLH